ncbi:hypothetical protein C8A01DRAFT_31428 [Parachaetomium inaequale]|uniref:Rhodopsin domain-containing protein n=1 Tax=Parachaetomium inaequale TaxID=2588326 RepID=A0AAN6PNN5_9PEZI|nr:hypothetical protein C8A01DRAFT_31428 [Parachaetomium inaequale]
MVFDAAWPNSTSPDNSTLPPPNSTFVWAIPPDAGRSLQPDIIACAVITFLIAAAFVALRFYTRGWVNRVLGASDWCILPALLCAAGVTASSLEQMVHGAGKHAWETDPFALPAFERAAWYGILFYNLSLTLSRISILLLYKRIFTYSWIKRTIQIVLILVIAIGIWLVVSVCTACMPLEAFWDWSLYFKGPVYCQPVNLWWANAALHITSDLVVMALPMPVLSSLNLPRRQKYAIVGVFAFGFFVCIISIVRLVTVIDVTQQQSWDATYTSAYMIYWTTVEVNASVACACVMTLKPLIQRVFPRLLSPSKGIREHTLQWITPVNSNNRDSIHTNHHHQHRHNSSPMIPVSPLTRRESNTSTHTTNKHRCSGSGSGSGSASNSGSALPHLHEYSERRQPDHDTVEKSRYYHSFTAAADAADYDLDRDIDLEAQRTCSSSVVSNRTAAGGGSSTRSAVDDDEEGEGEGEDYTPLDPYPGAYALRAPPRAHLRLSVHMPRFVGGEMWQPQQRSPGSGSNTRVGGDREGAGSVKKGGEDSA